MENRIQPKSQQEENEPRTNRGNASNPLPENPENQPQVDEQLLSKKAGSYLREAGNIEDLPDAQDWEEADKTLDEQS